jgi:hypothetical protein
VRFDPQCAVVCDECGDTEWWNPDFVYDDFSGKNGHYDTFDSAYHKWVKSIGWVVDDQDRDLCTGCQKQEAPE